MQSKHLADVRQERWPGQQIHNPFQDIVNLTEQVCLQFEEKPAEQGCADPIFGVSSATPAMQPKLVAEKYSLGQSAGESSIRWTLLKTTVIDL